MTEQGWLSTGETADRLGVTQRTVYGLINRGELAAYRVGRVIRVDPDDLAAYLESARIRPGDLDHITRT